MATDGELHRLRAAQDRSYERKQAAHSAQQRAWETLSAAREAMNREYESRLNAYQDQERTWQAVQTIRGANSPRIDSLNAQQETAYQNMKRAYDAASSAYDRRDGALASSYAAEGRGYKEESQRCVAERRRLVDEIRAARARHDATKPDLRRARDAFDVAKRAFDIAKREHDRARAEFKSAKSDFDQASGAFKARLSRIKAENAKRRDDKRSLAEKAGVPYRYRDKVWVSTDANGATNIYFGGVGDPNGPGHGHYAMDRSRKVTYRRDPFDPHGSQNFEWPGKDGHRGGFHRSQHGWIDDHAVTFALGWGTREGETLMADGHLSWEEFRQHNQHDHYGSGQGPNCNGTLRKKYSGPSA